MNEYERPEITANYLTPRLRRRALIGAIGVAVLSGCAANGEEVADVPTTIPTAEQPAPEHTPDVSSDELPMLSSATPEADTAPAAPETEASAESIAAPTLEQTLQEFGEKYSASIDVGLVAYDWQTGETVSYNADELFVTASIYKLYVAYGVLSAVDSGEISLDDPLEINDEAPDIILDDTTVTVGECLNEMITASSNTCGRALGEYIGWEKLDDRLQSEGYENTEVYAYRNGEEYSHQVTTAADVGLLLQRLYDGELLSAESTELFQTHLRAQEVNDSLPAGLPDGMTFEHKTGLLDTEEWGNYSHDVGVLRHGDRQVMIVALTGGWTGTIEDTIAEAPTAFGELGQRIAHAIDETPTS